MTTNLPGPYCPDCGTPILRGRPCPCSCNYPKQPTQEHTDLTARHLDALQKIKKLETALAASTAAVECNAKDAERYRKVREIRDWSCFAMATAKTPEEFDGAVDRVEQLDRTKAAAEGTS